MFESKPCYMNLCTPLVEGRRIGTLSNVSEVGSAHIYGPNHQILRVMPAPPGLRSTSASDTSTDAVKMAVWYPIVADKFAFFPLSRIWWSEDLFNVSKVGFC